MSIVIAHPTRQHSLRLAEALQDAGATVRYFTMLPTAECVGRWPTFAQTLFKKAVPRLQSSTLFVESIQVCTPPWVLKRTADVVFPSLSRTSEIASYLIFDQWVAHRLRSLHPKVFVGYEMASVTSFLMAKKLGALCVLDAAACASIRQDRVLESEKRNAVTRTGRLVRLRKKTELELADQIICCSKLALETYLEAGVAEQRLLVNPLGCDASLFRSSVRTASGPPKFFFAGTASETKGFGLLLQSFRAVQMLVPDAQLHIFGETRAAKRWGNIGGSEGILFHGKKSQSELASCFAQLDVLVLPSILDSFGMVVPEALGAGAYVIVSESAGAAMAIDAPELGMVIKSNDPQALTDALINTARDITQIRSCSELRKSAAIRYDWSRYKERAVALFKLLELQRPSCDTSGST